MAELIYIKLHMNLKNSIESIEIYNLGIFSSMLAKKYKFIPVSDIMNIWNLNFTNKNPDTCFPIFQNKTNSNITKNNLSKKKPQPKKNSDCLKPRMKIKDEDCVLKPRIQIKDEDCVLKIINPSMQITTEEKNEDTNEKKEEDTDTTIENEIIGSIIKKILFNEDTVSIPTYLTNYLNSNKIAMNIEKIIEYNDIEDILQDINF